MNRNLLLILWGGIAFSQGAAIQAQDLFSNSAAMQPASGWELEGRVRLPGKSMPFLSEESGGSLFSVPMTGEDSEDQASDLIRDTNPLEILTDKKRIHLSSPHEKHQTIISWMDKDQLYTWVSTSLEEDEEDEEELTLTVLYPVGEELARRHVRIDGPDVTFSHEEKVPGMHFLHKPKSPIWIKKDANGVPWIVITIMSGHSFKMRLHEYLYLVLMEKIITALEKRGSGAYIPMLQAGNSSHYKSASHNKKGSKKKSKSSTVRRVESQFKSGASDSTSKSTAKKTIENQTKKPTEKDTFTVLVTPKPITPARESSVARAARYKIPDEVLNLDNQDEAEAYIRQLEAQPETEERNINLLWARTALSIMKEGKFWDTYIVPFHHALELYKLYKKKHKSKSKSVHEYLKANYPELLKKIELYSDRLSHLEFSHELLASATPTPELKELLTGVWWDSSLEFFKLVSAYEWRKIKSRQRSDSEDSAYESSSLSSPTTEEMPPLENEPEMEVTSSSEEESNMEVVVTTTSEDPTLSNIEPGISDRRTFDQQMMWMQQQFTPVVVYPSPENQKKESEASSKKSTRHGLY